MPDRLSEAFQRALDEAASNDRAPHESPAAPTAGARMRGVAFGAPPGSGGKASFGLALDWADEPADPAPPLQPPRARGRGRPRPGRPPAPKAADAPSAPFCRPKPPGPQPPRRPRPGQ